MSVPQIAAADFETEPFLFGRVPRPGCWGIKTKNNYYAEWAELGRPCAESFVKYISGITEPLIIYFHNGGRFDVLFLAEWINPERIMMIQGRVVACKIGIHEIRDSMAIFPLALKSAAGKDHFDYAKLEAGVRDNHKAEIMDYLKSDCEYLFGLMETFVENATTLRSRSIPKTAASTAYKALEKRCPQPLNMAPKDPGRLRAWLENEREHDTYFRQYYKGGRVQPFEIGVIEGDFKLFDVNSMYPAVMKNCLFPRGKKYTVIQGARITADGWVAGFRNQMFFINFMGTCNSIPWKCEASKKTFYSARHGEWFLTSHEFRAAHALGLISIDSVIEVRIPVTVQNFAAHVDHYYGLRKSVGKTNKTLDTFFKLCLNSPYGKFAYSWKSYTEQLFDNCRGVHDYDALAANGWEESECCYDEDGIPLCRVLEHENTRESYYDVAIGAAITGAARAVLLTALHGATRPIYCDTDSILCEELGAGAKIGGELGEWKPELAGIKSAAIAGRKLYALFDGAGVMVKSASKGVRLSPMQHLSIAASPQNTAEHFNHAPTMRLGKQTSFTRRRVRQV